ncbi:hypothetical protein [Parasitella parasitica]|uniref:Uncharacterized protein n=1 Tax=Parasitella parasitica TaxID=35722 RepID=A0A0B7MNQ1_9FUNG|nr:hypothetical protein [Parasitella parasitica]
MYFKEARKEGIENDYSNSSNATVNMESVHNYNKRQSELEFKEQPLQKRRVRRMGIEEEEEFFEEMEEEEKDEEERTVFIQLIHPTFDFAEIRKGRRLKSYLVLQDPPYPSWLIMRFIELLVSITVVAAIAVSAAPLGGKDIVDTNKMVFDPQTMKRESGRRQQQRNKYEKRHKPCCGAGLGLGLDAQARLDLGGNAAAGTAVNPPVAANAAANAGAAANAAVPAPAPGDTINVRVENNHSH